MKVILVNGSPRPQGNTYISLQEVAKQFNEEGIETEIFQIGTDINPCRSCNSCHKTKKCAFNPKVNEFVEKAKEADGFIFGSPVYYASLASGMKCFMDTTFYSNSEVFALKPAASVIVARRAGTTSAFDEMNKYFTISRMFVVSSRYWNNAFGTQPGEVSQDEEGMYNMRLLAKNMAYLIKCQKAGEQLGIEKPDLKERKITNFIR